MAVSKPKKAKKERSGGLFSVLVRLAVAGFCCYLLVCLVSNEVDIMIKNQQISTLEQQIAQQQAETVEMQRLMESSADINQYYEKVAREKLGYSFPDERIFVDITGK